MKALLISSIGHDIDHSGYTNNFLHETDDPLFFLYQESTWENYHFYITSMLFDVSDFIDEKVAKWRLFPWIILGISNIQHNPQNLQGIDERNERSYFGYWSSTLFQEQQDIDTVDKG